MIKEGVKITLGRKARETFKWKSFSKENNIAVSQRMTRNNVAKISSGDCPYVTDFFFLEICDAVSVFKLVFSVIWSDVSFKILTGSHQWQELLLPH